MKNISILGSGWLGLPLAKELSSGYSIKLSTTTKEKKDHLSFDNIQGYRVDIDNIQNEIDAFLASEILIVNIPSKNIDSFKNLIQKIQNSKIKKVIYVSSTSVYKECNKIVNEDDNECYSSHPFLEIENLFLGLKNINTTILRFGGLIGYDRNLVKYFQEKAVPNSQNRVNMIHRDDSIAIIKKVLETKFSQGVFNCCASSHPTKEEFYTHCAKISEYKIPKFDNKKSNYKIVNNEKLKKQINYQYIYDDLLCLEK